MLLSAILVLLVIALGLVKSLFTPGAVRPVLESLIPASLCSEYKQLRIEAHQTIDRSLSPPRV
jgi:hypothetical protein